MQETPVCVVCKTAKNMHESLSRFCDRSFGFAVVFVNVPHFECETCGTHLVETKKVRDLQDAVFAEAARNIKAMPLKGGVLSFVIKMLGMTPKVFSMVSKIPYAKISGMTEEVLPDDFMLTVDFLGDDDLGASRDEVFGIISQELAHLKTS